MAAAAIAQRQRWRQQHGGCNSAAVGHYGLLMDLRRHPHVFRDHATPSGISSIWGPGLKRCASILLGSHAREVLRHNSQRNFR